jgi:GNAT superfamily N-acetyltransferase
LSEPEPIAAWVVENDDGIAGHVALNPSASAAVTRTVRSAGIEGELGVVARLLVDPRCRRQRLGALLLEHASLHAVSLGLIAVLDVVATSTAAIRLYRREGWIEIGQTSFDLPDGRRVAELVVRAPNCHGPQPPLPREC